LSVGFWAEDSRANVSEWRKACQRRCSSQLRAAAAAAAAAAHCWRWVVVALRHLQSVCIS